MGLSAASETGWREKAAGFAANSVVSPPPPIPYAMPFGARPITGYQRLAAASGARLGLSTCLLWFSTSLFEPPLLGFQLSHVRAGPRQPTLQWHQTPRSTMRSIAMSTGWRSSVTSRSSRETGAYSTTLACRFPSSYASVAEHRVYCYLLTLCSPS
jgi:hypothetical protein